MSDEKQGATFVGQVYDVTTKRDGGGKIRIDFGLDALEDIQWAQMIASKKGCNFQIAMVPIAKQYDDQCDFVPDHNGEIKL